MLTGMAKRGVAEVVSERNCLDQIFVDLQGTRDAPRDLRHFQRMCEARAKHVAFVINEDLCLVFQAPKRGTVNDAVAIALKLAAPARRRLLKQAATGR